MRQQCGLPVARVTLPYLLIIIIALFRLVKRANQIIVGGGKRKVSTQAWSIKGHITWEEYSVVNQQLMLTDNRTKFQS